MPADIAFRALTLPGFDGRPADPALSTASDYATRLAAKLAEEPRPRILLGHGIGGSLALQLVQDAPEAVDGLVLHAPVGARLGSRRLPWLMNLPGARRVGPMLFGAPLLRPVLGRLLFTRPLPAALQRRFFTAYRRCAAFGQSFDLFTPAWFATLRPVDLPAALLWGGRDRVLSPSHAADFRALLPAGRMRFVPGWGHFPMIDQPRAYATEISRLARELLVR